ncbi:MAG: hypothetical protein HY985_01050 [Magnetospirillum sp.]|nr:hypothetical protein [Magnetospirillum sp.]
MLARLVLFAAVAALAACTAAPVPWMNPELPKEHWAKDWTDCKRGAEREWLGGRDEDSESPLAGYDRIRNKKRIDGSVNYCMREKGYFPARPTKGD